MKILDSGFEPNEVLDERTRYVHEALRQLQEAYNKAAQPYLEELSRINAIRPRRYLIQLEEGEAMPPGYPGKTL